MNTDITPLAIKQSHICMRTFYYKQNRCVWIGKGRGLTQFPSLKEDIRRTKTPVSEEGVLARRERVKSTLGGIQNKQRIRAETGKQSLLLLREQFGGEKPQCFHGYL